MCRGGSVSGSGGGCADWPAGVEYAVVVLDAGLSPVPGGGGW